MPDIDVVPEEPKKKRKRKRKVRKEQQIVLTDTEELVVIIVKNYRTKRLRKRKTIKDIAESMGVKEHVVSAIEHHKRLKMPDILAYIFAIEGRFAAVESISLVVQ